MEFITDLSSRRDSTSSQTNNLPLFPLPFLSDEAERISRALYNSDNISCGDVSFVRFRLKPTRSFSTRVKPLMVTPSDKPIRPRFHNGSDAFLTPSSTPKTPSSWPPRPDSTGLRPTCVAGHVVSIFPRNAYNGHQTPCRDPVVMSPCPSWNVFMALEHERDVDFDFRQAGSYILKRSVKEMEKQPHKTNNKTNDKAIGLQQQRHSHER